MSLRDTAEFFDRYAHDFDAIYAGRHRSVRRLADRWLRRSMFLRYRLTLEGCAPVAGRTVLDVGCGPGHYSIALARMGARAVVGVDVAPAMIELARRKAREAGVADLCRFECRDFAAMPAGDRFDYVILMGFMDYVPEPQAVIARALAKTRARAFFSFPLRHGMLAWQRRLRYRRKTPLWLYGRDEVQRLFAGPPTVRTEICKIARDLFVTARVGAGP